MKKLIKAIAQIEVWAVTDDLAGVDAREAIGKTIEENPKNFQIISIDTAATGIGVCDSCDNNFKEYELEQHGSKHMCDACLDDELERERESKECAWAELKMESIKNGDYL